MELSVCECLLDIHNSSHAAYTDTLNGHGLESLITIPTRRNTTGQDTLIDHALSNLLVTPGSGVIEVSLTDHYCTVKSQDMHVKRKNIDRASLLNKISHSDWCPITAENDPEIAFEMFCNIISNAISESTTITTSKKRFASPRCPWMTDSLLKCVRRKDNLYKKTKKKPFNQTLLARYKCYSNILGRLLKNAKKKYCEKEIDRAGKDSRKQWKIINEFLNKTSSNPPISAVQVG